MPCVFSEEVTRSEVPHELLPKMPEIELIGDGAPKRPTFQRRGGVVAPTMPITFIATFMTDGTITVGPIDPESFETVSEQFMPVIAAVAGDTAIGHVGCLAPDQIEELAQRLARMLIREVT